MRGKLSWTRALGFRAVGRDPSMRPALYARETGAAECQDSSGSTSSFNEARALCAGNSVHGQPRHASYLLQRAFNEARALCAGNYGAK